MFIGVLGEIDFCLYYADFLALLFSCLFILHIEYDIEYSWCSINVCTPVLLPYEALFKNLYLLNLYVWFIICVERAYVYRRATCIFSSGYYVVLPLCLPPFAPERATE